MKAGNSLYWKLCCIIVIALTVLCLSPLVIPMGQFEPMLLGVPYTLWTSILLAIAIVIVNWIGVYVHPGEDNEPIINPNGNKEVSK